MATSHSGWGNCPAHKKNQLAMYPGVWYIRTSVFSVISVVGMWHVAVGGMGCGPRPCCPGSYSWLAPWMSCVCVCVRAGNNVSRPEPLRVKYW